MFEHPVSPPLPTSRFLARAAWYALPALAVIAGSLLLGMVGYVLTEHLSLIDAFLNAAMLLGGMGPVNAPQTFAGKLFAGFYALYAGLVFLVVAGILFAPMAHRVLHQFHWEMGKLKK